jgi:hypothetical protein
MAVTQPLYVKAITADKYEIVEIAPLLKNDPPAASHPKNAKHEAKNQKSWKRT